MTSYQISSFHDLGIFSGFKKFISKSSIIDMAIGVVMGTAISSIVSTFMSSIINPLIAMLFKKRDMSDILAFSYNGATVSLGAVLNALIQFFIIAMVIYFLIIVPVNKMHDVSKKLAKAKYKSEELEVIEQAAAKQGTDAEEKIVSLLTQIKEELGGNGASPRLSDLFAGDLPKEARAARAKKAHGTEGVRTPARGRGLGAARDGRAG